MFPAKINNYQHPLKVLVAPLDWGLGHATRCIPVIRSLIAENCEVLIAADGAIRNILQLEFPTLQFLNIEGYNISYSGSKRFLKWKLLFQFFRIRKVINAEKKWLKNAVEENNIGVIISDNRFGLSDNRIYSIFITHQLKIRTGSYLLDIVAQRINYGFINKYNECWVPDSHSNGFGGELSHPCKQPKIPVKYTGILSRFKPIDLPLTFQYLFLISGPEPQRSMFEKKLTAIAEGRDNICIVRGVPSGIQNNQVNGITFFNHLPAEHLNKLICSSKTVVCRSGYSSVMDLLATGSTAILVPTPGQTEQEYIAGYLSEKKIFRYVDEENLDQVFSTEAYPAVTASTETDKFIHDWVKRIKAD